MRSAALAALLLLAPTACVTVGHSFPAGRIERIELGTTTFDECYEWFGEPAAGGPVGYGSTTVTWIDASTGVFGRSFRSLVLDVGSDGEVFEARYFRNARDRRPPFPAFARLRIGQHDTDDVRELLGKPVAKLRSRRADTRWVERWDYTYALDVSELGTAIGEASCRVGFDASGRVSWLDSHHPPPGPTPDITWGVLGTAELHRQTHGPTVGTVLVTPLIAVVWVAEVAFVVVTFSWLFGGH